MRERAAIRACRVGHLPFTDLDLLDPPPLAFPHREALYEDDRHSGENSGQEERCEGEFRLAQDPEQPDDAIEVGDRIYVTTLWSPPTPEEIRASQTTSQR
ncbi:hypothetical protein C0992_002953, partial [Termitomyces sp. T32_za158]